MIDDRTPPYDLDAEEAVIGACLIDSDALDKVIGWLEPEHFYRDRNQWVYEALLAVRKQTSEINQITVAHELKQKGRLADLGGSDYLGNCVLNVPTSVHIKYYGQIVWRLAANRRLIESSYSIADIGYEASPDFGETIAKAENQLTEVRMEYPLDNDRVTEQDDGLLKFQHEQAEIAEMLEGGASWLTTPWDSFNKMVRLRPGTVTILAGPTSMGKTICAEMICEHGASKLGKNGLYFYNELSEYQLQCRRACRHMVLDARRAPNFYDVEDGKYLDSPAMAEHLKSVYQWPGEITMVNAAGWSVFQICSEIRDKAARGLADFVVIDYLQLIPRENVSRRDVVDARAIGIIVTALKQTCQNIKDQPPLIILSQVTRGINTKDDCKEEKLRDSGEIGQYSNAVVIIFNEWDATKGACAEDCKYWRGNDPKEGECWRRCVWACTVKNTFGPKGDVRLNQIPARFKIVDPDKPSIDPEKQGEMPGMEDGR